MHMDRPTSTVEPLGGLFRRLEGNPIIHPGMKGLEGDLGSNINGPSLVKVPPWLGNPLGKYYLYFANHHGKFIRLAYAENVEGPYTVYKEGSVQVKDVPLGRNHIGSPDVHVMEEEKAIWMYFHAPRCKHEQKNVFRDQGQVTFLATSRSDGIQFAVHKDILAPFYLRTFRHGGYVYGFAKNDNKDGVLLRSNDGKSPFKWGPEFLKGFRHCAILPKGDLVIVFYTRVGDNPEHVVFTTFSLDGDWMKWHPVHPPVDVLFPDMPWEGALLPSVESKYGSTGPTRALRDPCIFEDGGHVYLLYSVKGEQGIAISRLERTG